MTLNPSIRIQCAIRDRWLRVLRLAGRGPRPLLFEHIPKTAGTTVIEYLRLQYPARRIFHIDGMNPDESQKKFRDLESNQRHAYDLVYGHGAHKLMDLVNPRLAKATILRDPVDRLVSHYYFAKASPNHYLHKEIVDRKMSLAAYAQSDLSPELRNNLVRRFTGITWQDAELQPSTAIETTVSVLLSKYEIIGFTDNLRECLDLFAKTLGFHSRWNEKSHNVTKQRPSRETIPEEDLEIVRELNAVDLEVYRRVKEAVGTREI